MGFWILALTGAVVVLALLARAMVSPPERAEAATATFDVQVYRDQLKELDRDLARGVIGAAEADRARVEISRRLLEADRKAQAGETKARAPRALTWSVVAVAAALLIGGASWLYLTEGAPGYWDMPLQGRIAAADEALAKRISQQEAEDQVAPWAGPPGDAPADYIALVDKLRAAVAERPDDLQGEILLATHEAQLGNYRAARAAMQKALEIKGDTATAADWSQLTDLMVMAAAGYVSPEAETAINNALGLDRNDPVARYYAGLMYAQVGRPDVAFRLWKTLLESSSTDDPWVAPIRSQIEALAQLAGVSYQLPGATGPTTGGMPGPTADDMAAAADMTPEERAAMVEGMVNRLLDRLATEGGPAADWAKAIQVLGVQGNIEKAAAIYGEAQSVFAGREADLAMIAEAAKAAGVDTGAAPAPAAPAAGDGATLPVGPTADDVAAAADMTPEERLRMIDNMVTQLADKIGTEGGSPAEWSRLIESYRVMGETERAREAWDNAQRAYADDAAGLAEIRPTAQAAGVAE